MKMTFIQGLRKYNFRWIWKFTILMLLFSSVELLAPSPETAKLQRCTYQKAYKMNGAYCSDLGLYSVPVTLKTNIEILDLSVNRIRDLKTITFANYPNLKYLYLRDNMIQTVEDQVFEPLQNLQVLDLSLNGLQTIPSSILNLPYLRKLYIGENKLVHLERDLDEMDKPFKAPLEYLNMYNCDLKRFPDFGILPVLENLNISGNRLEELDPKNFTKLCKLKTIDLTHSFPAGNNICVNKSLAMWFIEKKIEMIPEVFSIYNPASEEFKRCPEYIPDENDYLNYDKCISKVYEIKKEATAKKTWIIIISSLGVFLIAIIIMLIIIHKRSSKKTKNEKLPIENEEQTENILKI